MATRGNKKMEIYKGTATFSELPSVKYYIITEAIIRYGSIWSVT